ncbi:AAA ATPase central domain protein [Thermoanaerobacter mathranii subsp. mathranii str. A3]|uniref:ATPase n=2 Tax=Thermoanaerobacter TaxID=1754 RepID=A0ABT9M471_9THEO|nr:MULTISPECIES: replication-associated recombination protein A [Thermoanaerobacter]ADH61290.1 AAA ATPase central domain protein [Thermoanaerobacter mathranii subsp. mathranii str. A3]MDP9750877.1 putative ATPase [Thermoanaerobacter pentosaceus]
MEYKQASIFDNEVRKNKPLADRMRPRTLDEFVGQEHLLGKGKLLRELIEKDNITSMILWGPPGVGKTTLAMIIANMTNSKFVTFSAVLSGIKEIKEIMAKAELDAMHGTRTVVFIDEIHRFNKAQQDAFLPHVEKGNIILIGATTENPSFEVNSALLSRSKVFVMKPLTEEDLLILLKRALKDEQNGLGMYKIGITEEQLKRIALFANGDARVALNTLEIAVMGAKVTEGRRIVTDDILADAMQKKTLLYDKQGEEHYNLISAFHKSLRNSDWDAAVYWLARMLEAGEDPLYIARRMIRFASEDIGLADPQALEMAVAAYNACHYIGMPECSVNLAQVAIYLALAPKSNAVYMAYNKAKEDAEETIAESVPMHLRNAPTKLMKELGYGKGYKYAHDFEDKVTDMQCLPDNLKDRKYYVPTDSGFEKDIQERLEQINNLKKRKK